MGEFLEALLVMWIIIFSMIFVMGFAMGFLEEDGHFDDLTIKYECNPRIKKWANVIKRIFTFLFIIFLV